MIAKQFVILSTFALTSFLCGRIFAQEMQSPFVRIAELEIHPARLEKQLPPMEKEDLTEKWRNNAERSR